MCVCVCERGSKKDYESEREWVIFLDLKTYCSNMPRREREGGGRREKERERARERG